MTFIDDFRACLRFWSRLPVRADAPHVEFRVAIRALPIAALAIAAPAVGALALGRAFGFSPFLAALIALGVLTATTGALHEDGLADCADALGGSTPERRLDIMKDSRIGTFGALALILSVGMRAEALATLAQDSLLLACAALLAVAALARVACLAPLALLPPARGDGAGKAAGAPDQRALGTAIAGALACAILPLLSGASAGRTILALICAFGAALAVAQVARIKLGGQTGDVAGAAEQSAEIAFLAVLSTALIGATELST